MAVFSKDSKFTWKARDFLQGVESFEGIAGFFASKENWTLDLPTVIGETGA